MLFIREVVKNLNVHLKVTEKSKTFHKENPKKSHRNPNSFTKKSKSSEKFKTIHLEIIMVVIASYMNDEDCIVHG